MTFLRIQSNRKIFQSKIYFLPITFNYKSLLISKLCTCQKLSVAIATDPTKIDKITKNFYTAKFHILALADKNFIEFCSFF